MTKKSFFKVRSEAEIHDLNRQNCEKKGLVNQIIGLDDSEYLIIPETVIPIEFSSPNKFKKHGAELRLRRFKSQEEMISNKLLPIQLRSETFDRIWEIYQTNGRGGFFSGYTFRPVGIDEIPRKVSLVSCLHGAQIFAYANQVSGAEIMLKDYDGSKIVSEEGGRFIFNVPSRTEKKSRWKVGLSNVAVIDNNMKYVIANSIDSDHTCDEKRYNREMRFKSREIGNSGIQREKSQVVQFCPHDIAAYMALADEYWNKKKNIVPLMVNPFAFPTQFSVDFYKKLLNNVLIKSTAKQKGKEVNVERQLNQAEQEIFLWGLVMNYGHDKTFFAKEKLAKYNW
jgi:hypothetical protein